MSRSLRRVAVVLVLAGVLAMAPQQLAYSSVEADRVTDVRTVTDPDAYLGIVDNSPNLGTIQDSGDLYYIDDNAGGVFDATDFTVSVVSYANCTTDTSVSCPAVSVGSSTDGYDFELVVSCSDTDIKATDTMTVSIRAASSVTVEADRTTSAAVDTNCRGSSGGNGFSSVNAEDITTGSGTQTLTFTPNTKMKSGDTVTIDLGDTTGVTYSNARVVSGRNQNTLHGSATLSGDVIEFTAGVNINAGTTVEIAVDYSTSSSGSTYTAVFSRSGTTAQDDFTVS